MSDQASDVIYLCCIKFSSRVKQSSEVRWGEPSNIIVVPALILQEMLCSHATVQPCEHGSLYWCVAIARPRPRWGSYFQDNSVLFTNQITAWVCYYLATLARNAFLFAWWEGWDPSFRDTFGDNSPVAYVQSFCGMLAGWWELKAIQMWHQMQLYKFCPVSFWKHIPPVFWSLPGLLLHHQVQIKVFL